MPSTLSFSEFGNPADVLKLKDEALPFMGPRDVCIKMKLSPIHPSDINFIEGRYGIKPTLPAVAGFEGVGEVVELGTDVTDLRLGQLVAPPREQGQWREASVAPRDQVTVFAEGLTVEQCAVSRTNPPTAWCLLHEFVNLHPGDWVVQNAANSAVGRAIIQIAEAKGIRTINIVRRPELIEELTEAGGDCVIVPSENSFNQVKAQVGSDSIKLGLNAVGGDSALDVARFLGRGGVHVTYGAMAKQPLKLPNSMLIFQDITFRGFWLTRWLREVAPERVEMMQVELAKYWQAGVLISQLEKSYPLSDFRAALEHAKQPFRSGKIAFAAN